MFEKYLTKTGKLSCKQPQDIKNQWYIQKFREVHGDNYDYSLVNYTTSRGTILVICPEHGLFSPTAQNHQSGRGCPKCQSVKMTKSHSKVIQEFEQVHGDTYDYTNVNYKNQHALVKIRCKIHGIFEQSPHHHLKGVGCPKCQHQNQDTLYLLRCENTGLIKIGITNNVNRRVQEIGGSLSILAQFKVPTPRKLETELHNRFFSIRVNNTQVNNGRTEFFQLTDTQIVSLIEELSQQWPST